VATRRFPTFPASTASGAWAGRSRLHRPDRHGHVDTAQTARRAARRLKRGHTVSRSPHRRTSSITSLAKISRLPSLQWRELVGVRLLDYVPDRFFKGGFARRLARLGASTRVGPPGEAGAGRFVGTSSRVGPTREGIAGPSDHSTVSTPTLARRQRCVEDGLPRVPTPEFRGELALAIVPGHTPKKVTRKQII
jgi:hypothetical protein